MAEYNKNGWFPKYLSSGTRREDVRRRLHEAGIRMTGPDTGCLTRRRFTASVHIEADEWVRVRRQSDAPENLPGALERHVHLPGNVRYARGPGGWSMVAETRLDGVDHLPESLAEIHQGFRALLQGKPKTARSGSKKGAVQSAQKTVKDVIQNSQLLGSDAVEIDSGWELRPRVGSTTVPVEARATTAGMRVSASVLHAVPKKPAALAIADQALRLNHQLRLVRLSLIDGALVAESCLRCHLVTAEWLEFTCRAVATACHAASQRMTVLSEETLVVERYISLLLDA